MKENWEKVLKDFVKVGDVSEETIKKYKKRVGEDIITLWREYGYGYFFNGFIKIINPDLFQETFENVYECLKHEIPIMVTGMADVLALESDRETFSVFLGRMEDTNVIEGGIDGLVRILTHPNLLDFVLENEPYDEAVEKYGELEYTECFGYTPLLSMGGYEDVEHLQKCDLLTHLQIMATLQGRYEW